MKTASTLLFLAGMCAVASAAAGDKEFTGDGYKIELVGRSGKIKVFKNQASSDFVMVTMSKLEEVDSSSNALSPAVTIPSWASQQFTWGQTSDCKPSADASLTACFKKTGMKFNNNGAGNTKTVDMWCQVDITNRSHWSLYLNDNGQMLETREAGEQCGGSRHCSIYCEKYRKLTCGSTAGQCGSTCTTGWYGDTEVGCSQCQGSLSIGGTPTTVAAPFDSSAAACPANWCFSSTGVAETTTPPSGGCTGDFPNPVTLTNATGGNKECSFIPRDVLKFSLAFDNMNWDAATNKLQWGVSLTSSGSSAKAGTPSTGACSDIEFDNGMYLESNGGCDRCDSSSSCGQACTVGCAAASDFSTMTYTFPHFGYSLTYDPVMGEASPAERSTVSLVVMLVCLSWH